MKVILLLFLLMQACLIAQAPALELVEKFEQLKQEIARNYAMILGTQNGKLVSTMIRRTFDLRRDRNYRVFLISNKPLGVVQATCTVSPESISRRRATGPDATQYGEVECYSWSLMTFSNQTSVTFEVKRPEGITDCEYALILASAGRSEWAYQKRMSDSSGNVYEIQGEDSVFRNGRKYISKTRYPLLSLCVTKQGTLFLLTREGYILRGSGTFLKRSREQAIWMVPGTNDNIFILFSDGSVYSRSGRMVYRRHNEKMAIDLVESNGVVWLITKEGERVELRSSVVPIDSSEM